MTTENPRASRTFGATISGLVAAAATPYLMSPLADRILMPFSDGEVSLIPLVAVSILLAPLPGLALGVLSDTARQIAIAVLAVLFVGTLVAILTTSAPGWVYLAETLSLGALTSNYALTTFLPRRAKE